MNTSLCPQKFAAKAVFTNLKQARIHHFWEGLVSNKDAGELG